MEGMKEIYRVPFRTSETIRVYRLGNTTLFGIYDHESKEFNHITI